MKLFAAGVLAICCLCIAAVPNAGAAGFCESPVRSFAVDPGFPRMTPVPVNAALPFGPRGVLLNGTELGRLPLQRSDLEFHLESPTRHVVNWRLEITIGRAGRGSRTPPPIYAAKVKIGSVGPDRNVQVRPPEKFQLGIYLRTLTFYSAGGKKLRSFGDYFRVMKPEFAVRLGRSSDTYSRGQTATICLENIGTEPVAFGEADEINRFSGSEWVPIDFGLGVPSAIGMVADPGVARPAWSFSIPGSAPDGLYRFRTSVSARPLGRARGVPEVAETEFSVAG